MRTPTCITAYLFGVMLGFMAAFTGSVGPEGPHTQLGSVLAAGYRPYYETFCVPLGGTGFFIGLLLSGVPFAAVAWLTFLVLGRMRRQQ
jgi:hypothetical protein